MTDTLPFRVLMLLPDEHSKVSSPDTAISLASSYYLFRDRGLEVVFASRLGGFSSIGAEMRRLAEEPAVSRMLTDTFARDELSEAIPLDKVYADDFDALILFVETLELDRPEIAGLVSEFAVAGNTVVSPDIASSLGNQGWAWDIVAIADARHGA